VTEVKHSVKNPAVASVLATNWINPISQHVELTVKNPAVASVLATVILCSAFTSGNPPTELIFASIAATAGATATAAAFYFKRKNNHQAQ